MRPLVNPPAAARDEKSIQMLSAWIAEEGLHCSINVGMWTEQGRDEPRAWGILLADMVRHIANALTDHAGNDRQETEAAVIQSLLDELDDPTSKMRGGFVPRHN